MPMASRTRSSVSRATVAHDVVAGEQDLVHDSRPRLDSARRSRIGARKASSAANSFFFTSTSPTRPSR
jgi:hypothetical protein